MNSPRRRSYNSPVRAARTQETRERILAGVATWFAERSEQPFTLEAIADLAGVERRTVFRHFATKDDLLAAFWTWINTRLTPQALPATLDELVEAPRQVFAHFDEQAGVIRASLHTDAGRAMRLAAVPARRAAFHAAIQSALPLSSEVDRRRLEAAAHCLYSAAAWETLREYAGLSGEEAGEVASWILALLVERLRADAASA
jgi:AcrR family transcriptional regulator